MPSIPHSAAINVAVVNIHWEIILSLAQRSGEVVKDIPYLQAIWTARGG